MPPRCITINVWMGYTPRGLFTGVTMPRVWTDDELDALKVYFDNDYSDIEIADALDRSADSVVKKRYSLGLKRERNLWTQEQIDFLKAPENRDKPNREIGAVLGKHAATVLKKRAELGLPTSVYRKWTPEELDVLFEHHKKGNAAVGRMLGRTTKAVGAKAAELGLPVKKAKFRGVANVS